MQHPKSEHIYNNIKDMEWKYARKPTPGAILEAFPDEAKEMVPREIKRLRKALAFNFDFVKLLKEDTSDPEFSQFQILVEKEIFMPKKKFNHLANLKAMERLMCKTTRGITDADIQKAKDVDIWTLHDFRERKGSSAICPFHSDINPSFAVRKNRFICFGCGAKGDAIDFYMKINGGMTFYKAVQELIKL